MEEGDDKESDSINSIYGFKKKVVSILEESKMSEKRASKMEIIDFLELLNVFNAAGIHFK